MDTRSVLGVRALRPAFLDDVSTAQARGAAGRRTQTCCRSDLMTRLGPVLSSIQRYVLDDEDEDDDEDRDPDNEDDDEDDEDEDEGEGEEETWQVSGGAVPLKVGLGLTSGPEVPRLTPICRPFGGLDRLGPTGVSRRRCTLSRTPVAG